MPFFVPGIIVLISGYGAASVPAIQGASTLSIIAAAAGKYAYDCFNEPDLPTFQHEAEVMGNKAMSEVRVLTSETRDKLAYDDELSNDEHARMGVELPRLASVVDTAESHNDTLADIIPTLLTQHEPNHELIQEVSEEQEQQRSDIHEIRDLLEGQLPRLIRVNQEKQALVTEVHQLKETNRALEGTVSDLSSALDDALACVEEGQAENDALRKQLRAYDEEKQGAKSNFGFSLFQS